MHASADEHWVQCCAFAPAPNSKIIKKKSTLMLTPLFSSRIVTDQHDIMNVLRPHRQPDLGSGAAHT